MCNAVDTMEQHRREQTTVYGLIATTTEQVLIPRDESRVSLILTCNDTVNLFYSWGDGGVIGAQIVQSQNSPPIILSLPLHGDMVRGPWRVRTSSGSQTVRAVSSSLIQSLVDAGKGR